jgi:hypothetical protein
MSLWLWLTLLSHSTVAAFTATAAKQDQSYPQDVLPFWMGRTRLAPRFALRASTPCASRQRTGQTRLTSHRTPPLLVPKDKIDAPTPRLVLHASCLVSQTLASASCLPSCHDPSARRLWVTLSSAPASSSA